jgi:prepilin-type N-terminal cleavage/methylation domain-containing protein
MRIRSAIGTSKLKASSGFTLVEVLVGLSIAAFALVTLYAGITYGMSVTEVTRENLRATQLILEKFETIRLYTWDQLNGVNGFVVPNSFTNSYTVDPTTGKGSGVVYNGTMTLETAPITASYSADMKLVTVTLNWTCAGVPRTRTMQTFVARQGLQQYVY